jgi:pilus assembly protein CpaC
VTIKLPHSYAQTGASVGALPGSPAPVAIVPSAPDEVDPDDLAAPAKDPQTQKFLSLYIGVDAQEKLPQLPVDANFKGDYSKVARVSISRATQTLLFVPIKEGVATLSIYNGRGKKLFEYRIDVKKSNLTKVAREIKSLLADVEGINIKIVNNKVVVDGQILLPRDMNRIYSVVSEYGAQASSLVTLSPLAQRKIAQLIEKDIGNPEITCRAVNEKFILEGVAKDVAEQQRAEIIAKTYVPDVIVEQAEAAQVIKKRKMAESPVINLITVSPAAPKEPGKIIQIVLNYVELSKDYDKSFSFDWSPAISDNSGVNFNSNSTNQGGIVTSITGVITNLLPKLNWLKSHGHARVLESSTLLVQDGQKGEFKSIENLPYQTIVVSGGSTIPQTQFAKVGLVTAVTPQVQAGRSDSIRMQLDFALSALLSMSTAGPTTSDNSMQTVIVVKSGQSAAVGGLITNNSSTDYNKLPQSTTTPIFRLYASKAFQRNQSQFVVFVTPLIKSSASAGAEKVKQKFRLRD